MAQPAANTTDRLPWLTEATRPAPPPPKPRRRKRLPWEWLVGAIAALALAAAFYWLGIRQPPQQAAPESSTSEVMPPGPVISQDSSGIPSVSDMTAGDELTAEPLPESKPEQQARDTAPEASEQDVASDERGAEQASSSTPESPVLPVTTAAPVQPLIRGRIIQLGAYPTRVQADYAWRAAVKRWPYLASKPRLISPLEVRSTDGKPTRMYRLQLATASQAQSVVICQQLEGGGQSCVVVY